MYDEVAARHFIVIQSMPCYRFAFTSVAWNHMARVTRVRADVALGATVFIDSSVA